VSSRPPLKLGRGGMLQPDSETFASNYSQLGKGEVVLNERTTPGVIDSAPDTSEFNFYYFYFNTRSYTQLTLCSDSQECSTRRTLLTDYVLFQFKFEFASLS
jgi:hypothetical protein